VAVDASSSFRWAASTQIFAAISEQRTGLVLTGLAREHSFDHWKDSYYFVQMKPEHGHYCHYYLFGWYSKRTRTYMG
jgi:hypothetical protein